jgi:hypothetical protein
MAICRTLNLLIKIVDILEEQVKTIRRDQFSTHLLLIVREDQGGQLQVDALMRRQLCLVPMTSFSDGSELHIMYIHSQESKI